MTNRKEIAEKIRKIDEYDCYEMAIYEIDKIIGTEKSTLFSDFLNRLADLIDPACHIVETVEDGETMYVCSNCNGCKSDDKDIFSQFNYCPVCGARVVRDEA